MDVLGLDVVGFDVVGLGGALGLDVVGLTVVGFDVVGVEVFGFGEGILVVGLADDITVGGAVGGDIVTESMWNDHLFVP